MKLIVGLGNPGEQFKNNRHNAGFLVLDKIALAMKLDWSMENKFNAEIAKSGDLILCKPQAMMNNSGLAVSKVMQFYKINPVDLTVINDDLDLEKGRVKKQNGAGSAGHNGVESIINAIGTQNFKRVRIGIGRPENLKIDPADYVLTDFGSQDEIPTLTLDDLVS